MGERRGECINTTREKGSTAAREDRDRGNKSSKKREFIEYANEDQGWLWFTGMAELARM